MHPSNEKQVDMKDIQTEFFAAFFFLMENFQVWRSKFRKKCTLNICNDVVVSTIISIVATFFFLEKVLYGLQNFRLPKKNSIKKKTYLTNLRTLHFCDLFSQMHVKSNLPYSL